jgi:hypothetical protein
VLSVPSRFLKTAFRLLLSELETPTHTCGAITAVTHPLSALNDPLVHTGHQPHETVAVREQVRRWVKSRSRWSTALGRGTYGGCVVGQDGQGFLRTLHRQVRRLLARRAASP